ncbi:hypothetical protein SUDANB106_00037 [Streptomyces sp. enrichment culture]
MSPVWVCGSRCWPWPQTVEAVLDRAAARHGGELVVVEGAGVGAERAAHRWCLERGLPAWRHRCHPRPPAGRYVVRLPRETLGARHERMLRDEGPRLVVVFHEAFTPGQGVSADIARRAVGAGVPVWLVPGADPVRGRWLTQADLPAAPAGLTDMPGLSPDLVSGSGCGPGLGEAPGRPDAPGDRSRPHAPPPDPDLPGARSGPDGSVSGLADAPAAPTCTS